MLQQVYEKYFTVEEAVGLLPFVAATCRKGHWELSELRDEIILYKRMHKIREDEGVLSQGPDIQVLLEILRQKWHEYEDSYYRWVDVLAEKGIQVRDFKKGLIDFPYKAKDGTDYFLCWHLGDEGLFYFHDGSEGYAGRKPISMLPE